MLSLLYAGCHLSILRLEVIASSSTYLEIASINALKNPNNLTIFIQRMSQLFGIFSFVILARAIVSGRLFPILLAVAACAWFGGIQIVGHSRFAAVYLFVAASVLFFSSHRKTALCFFVFGTLAIQIALEGRGSGQHGFSHVPNFLTYIGGAGWSDVEFIIMNTLQGIFVQGESFLYKFEYPINYKVLSLSPFPSGIDGFRENALQYAVRFTKYVPIGATGELFYFGPFFAAFYLGVVGFAYYRVNRLFDRRRFGLFLFCIMIFTLATYLQFTYPVRNVFRFFYLCIFLSFTPSLRSLKALRGPYLPQKT